MCRNHKCLKMLKLLCITLLSGVVLAGCRGGIGWDRSPGSLPQGHQPAIQHMQA